jgi:hypothetical protein
VRITELAVSRFVMAHPFPDPLHIHLNPQSE